MSILLFKALLCSFMMSASPETTLQFSRWNDTTVIKGDAEAEAEAKAMFFNGSGNGTVSNSENGMEAVPKFGASTSLVSVSRNIASLQFTV